MDRDSYEWLLRQQRFKDAADREDRIRAEAEANRDLLVERSQEQPMQRPSRHDSPKQILNGYRSIAVIAVVAILVLIMGFRSVTTVKAGQGCLLVRFGDVQEPMGPGLHFKAPVGDRKECLEIRVKTYEVLSSNEADSNADYRSPTVLLKTSEGIAFWVAYSLQYHIPVENVSAIYSSGLKSNDMIQTKVVEFHTGPIVQQILNTYPADQLYMGNLEPVSAAIKAVLSPRFAEKGIVLDYFELKRGDFDDPYEESIRQKARTNEQIKQKELEQQLAAEEAERVRIAQAGQATADAEKSKIEQDQANANTVTEAQAEAQAIALVGQAYEENPSALERERIAATANANIIYVPSGGVLPILGIQDPQDQP